MFPCIGRTKQLSEISSVSSHEKTTVFRFGKPWQIGLLLCLFVVAMSITPLYHENQNTKFLQALADAFPDRLGADWTASTVDGLPAFTFVIYAIAKYLDPFFYYVAQVLILGIMCLSLLAIARLQAPKTKNSTSFLIGVGALIVILANEQGAFLGGFAKQYIVGGYFQPCEFGALFLVALWLAHKGSPWATILAVIPAAFHPTYILFSAVLLPLIVIHQWQTERKFSPPLSILALTILILPPIDLALRFAPTDPDTYAQANNILAFQRIPRHSDPTHWIDHDAIAKLIFALVAIYLTPRGIIRHTLIAFVSIAIIGTLYVIITKDPQIALIAPWRTSVVFVPIGLAIVAGSLIEHLHTDPKLHQVQKVLRYGLPIAAIIIAGLGLWRSSTEFAKSAVEPHIQYILDNHKPTDIYLTSPRNKTFRLKAMTAQFVTWKSHPYKDLEVIEWQRRVKHADSIFGARRKARPSPAKACSNLQLLLKDYDVSHLLLKHAERSILENCELLEELFKSKNATIMKVKKS